MSLAYKPTPKQLQFHSCNTRHIKEVLYGGAAGGGKSMAIVMDAYEYAYHCPASSLLILRRTHNELQESIINKVLEHYPQGAYEYNKTDKILQFANGSRIKFGYLESEEDKHRYQGGEYSYIAFDELTHFSKTQYLYLMSRLRNTRGYPNLMRATSNPGGKYHDWVKERFIDTKARDRLYIPATLKDNPYLDYEEYASQLMHLPDIEREALLNGNWELNFGEVFKRDHFRRYGGALPDDLYIFTAVDVAMSESQKADRSAIVTIGLDSANQIHLLESQAGRWNTHEFKERIVDTCRHFSPLALGIEKTTASWHFVESFQELMRVRNLFIPFTELKPQGRAKKLRIESYVLSSLQQGKLFLYGEHEELIQEALHFPNGAHDDLLDALAYAIAMASERPREGKSESISHYYDEAVEGWL